ncbi:hypothetical protein LguiA_015476 [Lonicera macranthoides]
MAIFPILRSWTSDNHSFGHPHKFQGFGQPNMIQGFGAMLEQLDAGNASQPVFYTKYNGMLRENVDIPLDGFKY